MSPEPETTTLRETLARNRLAVLFGAVALVALIIVCVLVILLLRSTEETADGGEPGVATVTPFPTPQDPLVIRDEALVIGISDTETISVTLDIPVSLALAGKRFLLRPDSIPSSGVWTPELDQENTAAWVYGSIVNYVIGLPDSAANRELLGQLAPGEEMMLTTQAGTEYKFRFNSRDTVRTSAREVFAQNVPELTLILLGAEGEERLVVKGRYVVPEASGAAPRPVIELGETAQLDDVQITVNSASYMLDRPEAQPGFAFYMLDFQIQNVGLTALDTSLLRFLLLDGLGNQYALSPAASRLGNYPPLSGFLNSNQLATATAGYQIPIGLSGPALNWVVSRTDKGGQLQVTIPFSSGRDAAEQGARVDLFRAEVSADMTSLILGGQVTNLQEQPILATEGDVTLRTDDGSVYLLLSTNPPFPWTVSPNQTMQFQVTFQRPLSNDTAVFTVLNQPFELSGLR